MFRRVRHVLCCRFYTCKARDSLKQTALHDYHMHHGGKMITYAGWSMPVQYHCSIADSVNHTRQCASLFDVSHMLQIEVGGPDAVSLIEYVTVADLRMLDMETGTLSLFMNETGGIIDDCIIMKIEGEKFYIVSNASRADVVMTHLKRVVLEHQYKVTITSLDFMSLIALQGPKSAVMLQSGAGSNLQSLKFMYSKVLDLFDIPDCRVSRCGYTGEDGFEISVPSSEIVNLCNKLMSSSDSIKLAGLGARDILRLEAGLCLYGNDINEDTSPIEAGLSWCISKRRRQEGGFIGAKSVLHQLKQLPYRKRVGLKSVGPTPRSGCIVTDITGKKELGMVTSGAPSPSLGYNISMAYLPTSLSDIGTKVNIVVRKHIVTAEIVKLPFISTNYFK